MTEAGRPPGEAGQGRRGGSNLKGEGHVDEGGRASARKARPSPVQYAPRFSTREGIVAVKIHPQEHRGNDTDGAIARVINYIQERPRWVTSGELQDKCAVDSKLAYYVMHTLYMLDFVELGSIIAGRGRPKLAAQWIGRRNSTNIIRTYLVEGSGSKTGQDAVTRTVSERNASNGPSEISTSNEAHACTCEGDDAPCACKRAHPLARPPARPRALGVRDTCV